MSEVVLGRTYRDTATGFEGVATSKTQFLFGCERVALAKGHDAKGEVIDAVFDAPQLVELAEETVELRTALEAAGLRDAPATVAEPARDARTGGDRPMPSAER